MAKMRPCVVCNKQLAPDATTCPNCDTKDPFHTKRNNNILAGVVGVAIIAYLAFEHFAGGLNFLG